MDSQELAQYIIVGDAKKAEEWTQKALADGMEPLDIMNKGLIAGMEVVGDKFRNGIYYLLEVLLSDRKSVV